MLHYQLEILYRIDGKVFSPNQPVPLNHKRKVQRSGQKVQRSEPASAQVGKKCSNNIQLQPTPPPARANTVRYSNHCNLRKGTRIPYKPLLKDSKVLSPNQPVPMNHHHPIATITTSTSTYKYHHHRPPPHSASCSSANEVCAPMAEGKTPPVQVAASDHHHVCKWSTCAGL